MFQLAVVRQVLRKELGLKIVEVDSEKALVEGGDVLWTGRSQQLLPARTHWGSREYCTCWGSRKSLTTANWLHLCRTSIILCLSQSVKRTVLHPAIVSRGNPFNNDITSWAPNGCNIFCYPRVYWNFLCHP